MFSKEDLQVIQTVFGKTAEELNGALESETEVSLGLSLNGKVYTPEEAKTLGVKNQDSWIEVGFKNIAKELGIELDPGEKKADVVAKKLKDIVEKEMDEKYKDRTPAEELAQAIKAKEAAEDQYAILLKTHEELGVELEREKERLEVFKTETERKDRDNSILSLFPPDMTMDKKDALLIINNSLESEVIEGTLYHKVNGQIMTDPTGKAETLDNVINSFVEDKGWIKGKGKQGEDDDNKRKQMPDNLSNQAAMKYLEERNIEPMSAEGLEKFAQLTKNQ